MKQPSIEIGGKVFIVDTSVVTIQEWLELAILHQQGGSTEMGIKLTKLILKVLGPEAGKLPMAYLQVLIPRVLEVVFAVFSQDDVEHEVADILTRLDDSKG